MASKFTYEIGLDTKGYVDGVKQGKEANADFSTSIKKVKDNLPNLKKELNASRKEAMGLALAYSKLSESEKQSGFGKALARELEEAKKRTAELVDMTSDLQTEFKNLASDTATWDAMKEGIGVAKDIATGYIGTIATLSGKEKELQPLIAKIAAVQGLANSAISVGNALQKQSSIMLGIRRIQEAALAKSIELETVATGKATVAQQAFNAVAKANPYVLLASAAAAAVLGIIAYTNATYKSADATKQVELETTQFQKDLESINQTYRSKIASTYAELLTRYTALQNGYKKLRTEHEKTEWIKKYGNALDEAGIKVKSIADAERIYVNDTANVKKAFLERAQAAATYARLQELLQKKQEAQFKAQAEAGKNNFREGDEVRGSDIERYGLQQGIDYTKDINKIGNAMLTAAGALKMKERAVAKAMTNAGKEYDAEINALVDSIDESNIKVSDAIERPSKTTTKNDPFKPAKDSIDDLANRISTLQKQARAGILPKEFNTPEKLTDEIKRLQQEKLKLEIEWGFAKPDTIRQKIEKEISEAQTQLEISIDTNDKETEDKLRKLIKELQDQLEQHKLLIKGEVEIDPSIIEKELDKIANPSKEFEYDFDFSNLPENFKDAADKLSQALEESKSKLEAYSAAMNNNDDDHAIAEAQRRIDAEKLVFEELKKQGQAYEEMAEKQKKLNDTIQASGDMLNSLGSIASSVSTLFGDNAALNATAIIAQAVANYILGWSEATAKAAKLGPIGWAAFGLSTAAQVFAMVAQIKNAAKFADGGVVGGHSYIGDKLLARVNSKEVIMSEKQQKNALDLIDNNVSFNNVQTVNVVGKIRGKDLIIVAENNIKEMKKSGKNISFG